MATISRGSRATFDERTFSFLSELARNNRRDWFQRHKNRYEAFVLAPALSFIEAMAPKLRTISIHFDATSKRTGGSLMRIHRDTRFSRDKTPYKTNIGIQFRHERGRDVHAPGFYVHIEPGGCFLGAGLWRPDSGALRAIRNEIVDRPKAWRGASRGKRFSDHFALAGDSLKRPPPGFPADHAHVEDLKRKDFIAIAALAEGAVQEREFPTTVTSMLRRTSALMAFLCGAVDLSY